RERLDAVGRPAPAAGDRARDPARRARADPRRSHRRARHRIRTPGAGGPDPADARSHHPGHRAPALDHRTRRPGAGARPGPAGGAGHARRTAGAGRPVRAPAPDAVPRGRRRVSRSRREVPGYWYGNAPVPLHAQLLAGLYAAVAGVRRGLYGRGLLRARHPGRPVVVVGNIVAGGSGKTPLTIALVERLLGAGWTPGVASRGYGRSDAGKPAWVDAGTDPAIGGDEPVLIAARTGVRVRVDADRVAAARALVAEGCDIVVCDDGLQHYRLARDLEIEVIDGRRRYGNGRLLPAGPLREPPARGADCHFRVLNVGSDPDLAAGFGEWPMWLES